MAGPFGDNCSTADMHSEHTSFEVADTATVTLQDLNDLLTTAVEGGIGYWSECRNYRWENRPIVEVEIREFPQETAEKKGWHKITAMDLLPILPMIRHNSGQANGWTIDEIIENQDADIADVAVQLAHFGKVIYG
jgi:hypothetical protein